MNWLLYIGGGWIFIFVCLGRLGIKIEDPENKLELLVKIYTAISIKALFFVWIWICWRFIG